MAFSVFLRRGPSAAAPLLRRSLSACRALPLVRRPAPPPPPLAPLSQSRALLSSLARPSTDASLVRVIESEIECAEECDDHDRAQEVPEGFPFEIEDERGMNVVRLRRSYQGREQIEVVVSMPSLVTGEDDPHAPEEDEGEEEEAADQSQAQSHIPITVRVSKDQGGATLEFACTAYPDEIVIDILSVTESETGDGEEDDIIAYEGPDFK